MRTSAELGVLAVPLLADGGLRQASGVAFGLDERTVAAWWARAGRPGQAIQAPLVEQPRDLGQVPADEIRVKRQGSIVGMALARRVKTRWWLASEVSAHRDRPVSRRLIERVRACALHRPLGCCTEGVCSYLRAIRQTCRDPVRTGVQGRPRLRPWRHLCMVQVVNRDAQRRVVKVEPRVVDGTPARGEPLRCRSQGRGVSNTASIERLNATCRERWAALTRRGRALARRPLTRRHGRYLIGTLYNFCTPHQSLRSADPVAGVAGVERTPAMAAGLTEHCWTVRELLSFQVLPPRWLPPRQRGRPLCMLPRLMDRWYS